MPVIPADVIFNIAYIVVGVLTAFATVCIDGACNKNEEEEYSPKWDVLVLAAFLGIVASLALKVVVRS